MHQEKRIRGEYVDKQPVTENIASDQLTKKVYRPNLFFGISDCFGASPFPKTTETTKTAETQPAPAK